MIIRNSVFAIPLVAFALACGGGAPEAETPPASEATTAADGTTPASTDAPPADGEAPPAAEGDAAK